MGRGSSEPDGRVRILGWVHALLGGVGLAAGLLFCGMVLASEDEAHRALINIFGPIFFMLSAAYFLPSFLGGVGLVRGWPWARAVIWLESALLAFLIPVGTVLAGVNMWVLLSSRGEEGAGAASSYGKTVHAVEQWLKARIGFFLAALAAIASLGAMLGLGYLFRDQIENLPSPTPLFGGIVFVAAVGVVVVIGIIGGWAGPSVSLSPEAILLRIQAQREQKQRVAEHNARLARLRADPVRAKYADRMERGNDYWSDEQIAYDLDREARVSCQHLAPIEGAMREAGLLVKWLQPGCVDADCLIDEPALKRAGLQAESVSYREVEMGGRYYEDPPVGMLYCSACQSSIRVRNEHDKSPGVRTFPETA